jgi:hypothetical protein
MKKVTVPFTVWFIHIILVDVVCAQNPDELISKFKSNCKRFPRAGVVKYDADYPAHPKLSGSSEVRFLPEHRSLRSVSPAHKGTIHHEGVTFANPHYSATVWKQEAGWVINKSVEPIGSKTYFTGDITLLSTITNPCQILTTDYQVASSSTTPLGGVDYFVVTLTSDEEDQFSIALARLWFRQEGEHVTSDYPEIIESVEKRDVLKLDGPSATVCLYSDFVSLDGYSFPSRMQAFRGMLTPEQWDVRQTKLASTTTVDYSLIDTTPRATEFYLTHYGLPEPDFYSPPWPWWLYASAVGVGLVLIGVLVLQLGRRLRRRS